MKIDFISSYLPEISVAVFGFLALLLILYYLVIFSRFAFHKQKPLESKTPPVSIVITAKNDAHHLLRTLPVFLTQEYYEYEVVIVNDNSNDETYHVVLDFQNRFPNLRLVNLESSVTNIKGKKFPLSLGIKVANYEHVLLTDADCLPQSVKWVQLMVRHFNNTTKIVLGFNNIPKKTGFFNALIRFDKLHQAIQYFSYCLAKIPFKGVGQNLAYTKNTFFAKKGFASLNHLRFGDDDLFIHKVATSNNCAIEYGQESHTISRTSSTFGNWLLVKIFQSKIRKYYTKSGRLLLNSYHFLMTVFYIAFGFALYFTLSHLAYLLIITSILLVKFAIQYICFGYAAIKLNEKGLIPHIAFFDILFSVLNPAIYLASKFKD